MLSQLKPGQLYTQYLWKRPHAFSHFCDKLSTMRCWSDWDYSTDSLVESRHGAVGLCLAAIPPSEIVRPNTRDI